MAGLHRRSFIVSNALGGKRIYEPNGTVDPKHRRHTRWAAVFRARETERPDALFSDPLAGKLAGELGQRIADEVPGGSSHTWAWVLRTYLFDQFISQQIEQGADMVVNLAAGLDARPYRMTLPPSLHWVEVDLPEVIDYKEKVIGDEKPVCALERIRMDLADQNARRNLFDRLGHDARKSLIVTEGIVIYLSPEEVGCWLEDLARPASFRSWVVELSSPGLLKILQKQLGPGLSESGASFKFGPQQGPAFFMQYGWKPAQVRSMLKSAAQMKRLSPWMWLLSLLPESTGSGIAAVVGCHLAVENLTGGALRGDWCTKPIPTPKLSPRNRAEREMPIRRTRWKSTVIREIQPARGRPRHPKKPSISIRGFFSRPDHSCATLPCSSSPAFHGGWTDEARCLDDLRRSHLGQLLWLPPLQKETSQTSLFD